MKPILLSILLFSTTLSVISQEKPSGLTYQFYGFVRADAAYDTRQSVAANEGLFFLYPKNEEKDANGEDLNAVSNGGFYSFNTRAGFNISGLKALNAQITAKAEGDFAGFSGSFGANSTILRIRQAYIKMQWQRTGLLLGQTWHPMFGPVYPDIISLSTGAPFNPFNRSPQVRLDYKLQNVTFSGAGIFQLQFTSNGPLGKTNTYQRNALLPELYLGIDYKHSGIMAGGGIDYLTLKPRTQSTVNKLDGNNQPVSATYKVNESLSSFSCYAYLKYTQNLFAVSAKTVLGQNLSNATMLGGYGISKIDENTGKQEYTNFNHSTTWLNIAYGKKYMGCVFAGYTKNLGTDKALVNPALYGEGLTMNSLYRVCGNFTYNIPHFSMGLEYEMTTAAYGDTGSLDMQEGTYKSSHDIRNHRVIGVISYIF